MSRLPRIGIGTIQPGVDGAPIAWGLMDALEQAGRRVQSFSSRACFAPLDGATAITGQAPRHLDTWLMSPESCRDVLIRGCKSSHLALVEGRFRSALAPECAVGGDFETLCRWLDLPKLAVLNASRLSCCQFPARPQDVDGILLDRVASQQQLIRLQTTIEGLWGVPVLGSLGLLDSLREVFKRLPAGSIPSSELCRVLGNDFKRCSQLERIYRIAERRDFSSTRLAPQEHAEPLSLQVAVAYDDAFHCYFPDTMDLLELKGATLCDFSPLRDERLPAGTDLVYIGCGRPDLYAQELAENQCMMLALQNHLCSGKRIYAECGGLAYLGQSLETPNGERLPMAGVLPLAARLNQPCAPPEAAELTLGLPNWLGPRGAKLRGYRNSAWTIEPAGSLCSFSADPAARWDLVGMHELVGSRLHVNFAAQPDFMNHFFTPSRTAEMAIPSARQF